MICVLFALMTSCANGAASVLQRRAARNVPSTSAMHLSLMGRLLRQKVWLAGIGMVIVAAVCQAVALGTGPIAVVQPIFVIELPATLLLASLVFRVRLPRTVWVAVVTVTGGLALGMAAAAPGGGRNTVTGLAWVPVLVVVVAFQVVVIAAGVHARGNLRAALLGLSAACAYALTAALMKDAVARVDRGPAVFFTSWQLYATAVVGLGALFLLQNALQAGVLAASQPMLTLGDALISVALGVVLFAERIRTGWWLLPELGAIALVALGVVELAHSPLASGGPGRSTTGTAGSHRTTRRR